MTRASPPPPAGRLPVVVAFGTRPEAIKMAPVLWALEESERLRPVVVVTGQHRDLLQQVLDLFGVRPDVNLDIMQAGQSLTDITCRVLQGMAGVLEQLAPALVVIQGDTTSALAAALAAFYARVPVAHVEAGLRTRDPYLPFPEEMNRRLIGRLAALHFAPTPSAVDNLLREGIDPGSIFLTGNTVIDSLLHVARKDPLPPPDLPPEALRAGRLLLLTAHRRENWGAPLARIFTAVTEILSRFPDVGVVVSVHPNPRVARVAREMLGGRDRVWLVRPPDYAGMVALLKRACLVLTDSGGLQEEAPVLGRPVLVLREATERPEGIRAGIARLVGTDPQRIVREAARLLADPLAYRRRARAVNPYGDGRAGRRIVAAVEYHLGFRSQPPEPFAPSSPPSAGGSGESKPATLDR